MRYLVNWLGSTQWHVPTEECLGRRECVGPNKSGQIGTGTSKQDLLKLTEACMYESLTHTYHPTSQLGYPSCYSWLQMLAMGSPFASGPPTPGQLQQHSNTGKWANLLRSSNFHWRERHPRMTLLPVWNPRSRVISFFLRQWHCNVNG